MRSSWILLILRALILSPIAAIKSILSQEGSALQFEGGVSFRSAGTFKNFLKVFMCVTAAIVNEVKSNCTCGGFSTVTPDPNSTPLLSQAPGLVVQCDENGQNTCKDLCLALATATKAKGPEILCNRLKNADELKLSAFYKVCEVPWTYAGMTADEPLCCFDANVVVCGSATTSVPDKSV